MTQIKESLLYIRGPENVVFHQVINTQFPAHIATLDLNSWICFVVNLFCHEFKVGGARLEKLMLDIFVQHFRF